MSTSTRNRLYGKLKEEINQPRGELLTSMIQWDSSLDMITKRSVQLLAAFQAVKQKKFKYAAKLLRIEIPRGAKKRSSRQQSATSLWMEYWMGWAPLVGDIAHAIETLTRAPKKPSFTHFSVAVAQTSVVDKSTFVVTNATWKAYRRRKNVLSKKQFFTAYGDYRVINHNLVLADQLGFTNPALTAWQLIPFSWMFDWFGNVGTILGSLTDFLGVEFVNTGQASRVELFHELEIVEYGTEQYREYEGQWPMKTRLILWDDLRQSCRYTSNVRTPGPLPSPSFNIAMLNRLSLTRAATSISLLYESFLRK